MLDAGVSFEWQTHAVIHARKMPVHAIGMPYFLLPRKEQPGVKDVLAERQTGFWRRMTFVPPVDLQ